MASPFKTSCSTILMSVAIAASVSIMGGFQIEGVIVLADAETIRTQAQDEYVGDTIERQLADANIVLLNKADLVSDEHIDTLKNWLATMSPEAEVITAQQAKVPNEVVMQGFDQPAIAANNAPHAPAFQSRVIPFPTEVDAEEIARRLADPSLSLVRAKGFVPTSQGMRAIQIVGRRWAVTDAPEGVQPGVVVIAQSVEQGLDHIEALFNTT
ncbi:MAG: GTP-binding protein [Paracoccaceae bacterium]